MWKLGGVEGSGDDDMIALVPFWLSVYQGSIRAYCTILHSS